ncbi:MAG: site-2 protease family protein [Bryobacteraceae bacterium]|jgi:hypothetical protein
MIFFLLLLVWVPLSLSRLYEVARTRGFPSDVGVYVYLGIVAVALPLSILVHELGHAFAGAAVGWRFRSLAVGPLELVRFPHGWRFRHNRAGHLGFVTLVPATLAGFRRRFWIYAAGGPVATLLLALACASMAWQAMDPALFWLTAVIAQWALLSSFSFVADLMFPDYRQRVSDGQRLRELSRGGEAVDRLQCALLSLTSDATPLRPRDWPAALIRRCAETPGPKSERRHAFYLSYVQSLDSGDVQAASSWLAKLLERWEATDPAEYSLEATYFYGFHERDPDKARQWLDVQLEDPEPWVRLRAEGAFALADGRPDDARRLVEQALSALNDAPGSGASVYEADLLNAMLHEIRAPL